MQRAIVVLFLVALLAACHRSPPPSPHLFGASPALAVSAWYVDPASSVAICSDGNSGASSGTPLCTVGAIVSRWGTNNPHLAQNTTINILSDQAAGVDPVDIRPRMTSSNQYLTISGTPIQTGTATIGTFTPRNRATAQVNTITASGQSSSFWSSFVGSFVIDTTATAYFWIEKDLGSATAQITEPVPTTANTQFPLIFSYTTIANGDSLTLYRMPKLNCAHIGGDELTSSTLLQHVQCTGSGTGSTSVLGVTMIAESRLDSNEVIDQCSGQPLAIRAYAANSYIDASAMALAGFWQSGAIKASSSVSIGCAAWTDQRGGFDGDILIDTGSSFHASTTTIFGRVYLGTGVLLDTDGGGLFNVGTYDGPGLFFTDAFLWGPGKVDMHDHAELTCNVTCASSLLVTGGVTIHNTASTTAFPWNAATHSWLAPATITGAAIDDAGAMCDPATGDCYRHKQ